MDAYGMQNVNICQFVERNTAVSLRLSIEQLPGNRKLSQVENRAVRDVHAPLGRRIDGSVVHGS
jgi:predicted FMN-binding regulatory protein PaiB